MAIKLAVLKSGEDVIADIREMMVGDEDTPDDQKKVVGYYFIKPCGVTLKNKAIDVNESADDSFELKLFPWCPLAKNDENEVLSKFKEVLKTKQEEEEANASKSSDTNKPQQISISDR